MEIKKIELRIIFNSFGDKTVEATINGKFSASAPCGISKSSYRAEDVDVLIGIKNFRNIKRKFIGRLTQQELDDLLKKYISKLGSTITTAISLAFFLANFRLRNDQKFPYLLGNVMGGGSFSLSQECKMEIQEILTIPVEKDIRSIIEINFLIWKEVGNKLKRKGKLLGFNPESGWLAKVTNEEALDLVCKIAEEYGARIGIDFAASHIFKNGIYVYHDRKRSKNDHIDYVVNLIKMYNLVYVEDPVWEKDFEGYVEVRRKTKSLICGDDLTATHPERVETAARKEAINCVLIKPNQAGNVSDCLEIFKLAKKYRLKTVVSHRSKETCCPVVTRLALKANFAKFGIAGIRICKLNELIRLWDKIKNPMMRKITLS